MEQQLSLTPTAAEAAWVRKLRSAAEAFVASEFDVNQEFAGHAAQRFMVEAEAAFRLAVGCPPWATGTAVAKADAFDRFWSTYPRREGKGQARKAWEKAVRKTDAETIIAGAARFAADPNREPQFTAHASTWLNGERWTDEPLPPRSNGAPRKESAVEKMTRLGIMR